MRITFSIAWRATLIASVGACNDPSQPNEEATHSQEIPQTSIVAAVAVTNVKAASGRLYAVATNGLQIGSIYYIDRSYQTVSPFPSALNGYRFIKTAKADRTYSPGSTKFLTFTVDREAMVYVAHDDRIPRPRWLSSGFQNTGKDILTNDGSARFSVFVRKVAKGTVTLGANADVVTDYPMYYVAVAAATSTTHAGFYVALGGTGSNDGSAAKPWNLATALSGAGGRIKPGDTVWVRGGTYATGSLNVTLAGTPSAPVIVRAYPGERAVIDGRNGGAASSGVLTVNGGYVWYWGLEITNSNAAVTDVFGFNVFAPGVKFINCIVHDVSAGNAIWEGAANTEVTGCLIYNTGYAAGAGGGGYGHGIYTQSMDPNTNLFRQNILYNNYGWGFHAYAEGGHIQGYTLTDNIAFGNGIPAGSPRPGFFIGGGPAQAKRVTMLRNSSYMIASVGGGRSIELGWSSQNADVDFEDNWMTGGEPGFHLNRWATAVIRNNRAYSRTRIALDVDGKLAGYTWQGNHWWGPNPSWGDKWQKDNIGFAWAGWRSATGLGSSDVATAGAPTSNWIRTAASPYEAGRGTIVVYNWTKAATVSVDLSGIVPAGRGFEVRNVQQPFGPAVATGVGGGIVSLPMVGVHPPTPLRGWRVSIPVTGPEFQAFVVSPKR